MPEMPALARALTTSGPYRLFARWVLLPWLLHDERMAGAGLETGAGSGAMTAQLLAAFPDLQMTATDYDPAMVTAARKTLASFGGRASLERAGAADLPFGDGRFDLVLSAAMLHHVLAWDKALAEGVRVLRPGGLLTGYDVLDTPAFRLLHHGGGHHTRLLRPGQLEAGHAACADQCAHPPRRRWPGHQIHRKEDADPHSGCPRTRRRPARDHWGQGRTIRTRCRPSSSSISRTRRRSVTGPVSRITARGKAAGRSSPAGQT